MTLIKLLLSLTVFLTPLLGATQNIGYEQTKILFFILSISLMGFLWMLQKPEIKLTKVTKAAGIFILSLILTSFLGMDFKASFLGNPPYLQGLAVYCYLFLFSLMVSFFKIKLNYYVFSLTASGLVVSTLAIEDWILKNLFSFAVPNYAGRVVSTFGQPNFYAGFLLLTLPFCYLLFKHPEKKLRYLSILSGLAAIIGIFVSYSRSAILLALFLLILGLIDQLKIKLKLGLVIFGVGALLISTVIALKFSSGLVGIEFTKPVITNYSDQTKFSVEKRVYIWPQILKIVLEKPITGYGLDNINLSFNNYFKKYNHQIFEENLNIQPVLISLKDLNLDRTHNYMLDLLMFSGGLGLVSWLILVFMLFKKLVQTHNGHSKFVVLTGLLTYLVWVQFQNQSIVHLIYFWLLVGFIDSNS